MIATGERRTVACRASARNGSAGCDRWSSEARWRSCCSQDARARTRSNPSRGRRRQGQRSPPPLQRRPPRSTSSRRPAPATLSAPGEGDTRTLTLSNARDRSLTFTGGPSPQARSVDTAEVVDALGAGNTHHEATLSWSSATGSGAIAVTLVSGAYDPGAGTLTYQVIPLDPSDATSTVVAARATTSADAKGGQSSLPEGITASTLFIDPINQDQAVANCNLTIENQTQLAGIVGDINKQTEGRMSDWDHPSPRARRLLPGARSPPGRGTPRGTATPT